MATACRPPVVATLPRSLYLETTNRCDSKCQTCIRTFTYDLWQADRGLARSIRYLDMLAWKRFEPTIIGQVRAAIVFTERDRQALAQFAQQTPIVTIPFGTFPPEKPLNPLGDVPLNLLFVGNFIHRPNIDAALRLIRAIFPRVQARYPEVVLHVVDDRPPREIRRLANGNVFVTGRVPDVRPYLDRAAVVGVPLRLGGGMRVKVVEALAAGKAIVASPLAIEGLHIVDGEQLRLPRVTMNSVRPSFIFWVIRRAAPHSRLGPARGRASISVGIRR